MRTSLFCAAMLLFVWTAKGQSLGNILKQEAGQGAKQGAAIAVEKTANKVTDKVLGKLFDKKKNKGTTGNIPPGTEANSSNGEKAAKDMQDAPLTMETYSKFDFIPGEKVLAYDDFAKDAIGDFPVAWNTNSSGEIVMSSTRTGHWLMISKQGKFIPEYITSLPDNFTFEYDITCNEKFNDYSPALSVYILTGPTGQPVFDNFFLLDGKRDGIRFGVQPTGAIDNKGYAYEESYEEGKSIIHNQIPTAQFSDWEGKGDRRVHVSIWRQKQRIRVYLNEEKVFDIPRAFATNKTYSTLFFEIFGDFKNDDRYLLGNLNLSIGAPDTRTRLITEGKFVTNGILYDVNSDQIKPESYGVLKDIAYVLTENPSVKVKVIGHTDSDGTAANNLDLSKRRAEAVKNALVTEFSIEASRLETDGKGATQPVDSNDTPAGKANNRRVEFIKL